MRQSVLSGLLCGLLLRLDQAARNEQFGDGKLQHMDCYECLNPLESFWSQWWGDDMPTKAALKARELTREALAWADEHVICP